MNATNTMKSSRRETAERRLRTILADSRRQMIASGDGYEVQHTSPFTGTTTITRHSDLASIVDRYRPVTLDERLSLEHIYR